MTHVRDELAALEALLPIALEAQWATAPVARPREDTAERSKNYRADPTGDLASDPTRLQLRESVVRSASTLWRGALALREVRQDVARALTPWTGEDSGA